MTKRPPDQVIEYRISLQDKQSEQLDSLIAAIQFNRVTTGVGSVLTGLGIPEIAKDLNDPKQMIETFYSIAMIVEFLGYDTILPTPFDFFDYKKEYEAARKDRRETGVAGGAAGDYSFGALIFNLLNPNWEIFGVPWPGSAGDPGGGTV